MKQKYKKNKKAQMTLVTYPNSDKNEEHDDHREGDRASLLMTSDDRDEESDIVGQRAYV